MFGLVQVGYTIALGVTRSLFSSVALVSPASSEPTRRHLGSVDAVTTSSGVVLLVALPWLLTHSPWVALTALGIGFTLVQDALRFASIATGRGRDAVVSDGLWLMGLAATFPLAQNADPWAIAAAWSLASSFGVVVNACLLRWRPAILRGIWFARDRPGLSGSFLGEWGLKQGAAMIATYAIGLTGGALTIAGIRATQLLLGPLNILFTGLQLAALPTAVKQRDYSLPAMRRTLRLLSLTLGAAPLVLAGLVLLTPNYLIEIIVGNQAQGLREYVLPLALASSATGLMSGSLSGLRVLRAGGKMLSTRLVTTSLTLVAGGVGYLANGSTLHGLWGLAIGGLLSVLLWERAFARTYRTRVGGNGSRDAIG